MTNKGRLLNTLKVPKKAIRTPNLACFSTIITLVLLFPLLAGADTIITEASYFTRASCLKEGTSGIMANGKELNDERKIAASWDFPFGTLLRVTNLANGRSVVCSVEDRGPNRRLYRMGRRLDLSKAAMRELDGIKQGVIQVRIERKGD